MGWLAVSSGPTQAIIRVQCLFRRALARSRYARKQLDKFAKTPGTTHRPTARLDQAQPAAGQAGRQAGSQTIIDRQEGGKQMCSALAN